MNGRRGCGREQRSQHVRYDHLAQRRLRNAINSLAVINDRQNGLHGHRGRAKNGRIDVNRSRVLGQRLLGIKGRGVNTSIDHGVEDGDNYEETPLHGY
jgi:hypothetical protein